MKASSIKKIFTALTAVFWLCAAVVLCLSCAPEAPEGSPNFLQGITRFSLTGENAGAAQAEMFALLGEIEEQVSARLPGSDVYKINEAGAGEGIAAGAHTLELLRLSKHYAQLTGNAFNPALESVSREWNYFKSGSPVPGSERLAQLLVDCDISFFTESGGAVTKSRAGAMLDFGAIAKGYAADLCAEIAREHGVNGTINISGNIWMLGMVQDSSGARPYRVGITDPRGGENGNYSYFARINLHDTSVVTSGDYERFFIAGGKRYHHILDSATGAPSASGLISVTVISENSALADALSTALFVMGMERAIDFAAENSIAVVLVDENMQYYNSPGIELENVFETYTPYEQQS